jgi:putative membrane protein
MIKLISSGVVLAAIAAALCVPVQAQNENMGTTNTIEPGSDRRHTNLSNPPAGSDMLSEAGVVGVLQTVDQGETEAAQAALARSKNEDVLAFARQMIVDHGEASRKLNDVGIQPANSDLSRRIKDKEKSNSRKLNRLEGPAFDRAYMSAMVEDHQMVLDKIDKTFVPSAKSGALTSHLEERRPVIDLRGRRRGTGPGLAQRSGRRRKRRRNSARVPHASSTASR